MNNKIILNEETCNEITKILANKVIDAEEQDKGKIKRVYFNWIGFVNSLKEED